MQQASMHMQQASTLAANHPLMKQAPRLLPWHKPTDEKISI